MKPYYLFLALTITLGMVNPAYSQSWSLGLRLGDPSGLTFKRYQPGKALEINIGRTRYGYRNNWYDKHFNDWYGKQNFPYEEFSYVGYRARAPIAVQVHYLLQKPLGKISQSSPGRLDWYYGFGGQARFNTYYYNYRYKLKGNNSWIYVTDERVPDIDLGVDALIGLEYFFKAPISLFLDATLFMEVVDDPFLFRTQAGLGVRFRFIR